MPFRRNSQFGLADRTVPGHGVRVMAQFISATPVACGIVVEDLIRRGKGGGLGFGLGAVPLRGVVALARHATGTLYSALTIAIARS